MNHDRVGGGGLDKNHLAVQFLSLVTRCNLLTLPMPIAEKHSHRLMLNSYIGCGGHEESAEALKLKVTINGQKFIIWKCVGHCRWIGIEQQMTEY